VRPTGISRVARLPRMMRVAQAFAGPAGQDVATATTDGNATGIGPVAFAARRLADASEALAAEAAARGDLARDGDPVDVAFTPDRALAPS
jgi:hypothetical protein